MCEVERCWYVSVLCLIWAVSTPPYQVSTSPKRRRTCCVSPILSISSPNLGTPKDDPRLATTNSSPHPIPTNRQMVTEHRQRAHGRFNFLLYLALTAIVAILVSRTAPRLCAVLHHFGTRTSSSGPRSTINPAADSGALRGICQQYLGAPLHQAIAAFGTSQTKPTDTHTTSDTVSLQTCFTATTSLCHSPIATQTKHSSSHSLTH